MTEQSTGHSAATPSEKVRAEAKKAPGKWLYTFDPAYDPDGDVPPIAIIGAWKVDDEGEPTEFLPNPDYRPSPMALALPEATDPVDAAVQWAATGHAPLDAVAAALVGATVYLVPDEEAVGELITYQDDEGPLVQVFTDPRHAPPTVPRLQAITIAELSGVLPDDTAIVINPGAAVSVRLAAADIRDVVASPDTTEAEEESPVAQDVAPAPAAAAGIPHKSGPPTGP